MKISDSTQELWWTAYEY